MRELENKMAECSSNELEVILDRYGKVQQQFSDLDGYIIDSKINEICNIFLGLIII